MKSSRGISVIALVITVIVIVIITSITTYTGINMISDTRKKDATDKLKVICNALRKDDSFLNFDTGEKILTEQDFINLDLDDYYDEKYPVKLTKSTIETLTDTTRQYSLDMYKGEDRTNPYATESFDIVKSVEKNVYEALFNEIKGVNRPVLTDGMYALTSDGTKQVEDVYEDDWYNYNSTVPSFAKMKYDSDGDDSIDDEQKTFVWIPRYAYSIQSFYNGLNNVGKSYVNVQPSAMKIIFLSGTTNYMHNDEVIPTGYYVHPAFRNGDTELSGIWVEMETSEDSVTLSNAITKASSVVPSSDAAAESHLMTNSEYAAALYLMFSMNYFDEINFTLKNEFVAGGLDTSGRLDDLKYVDLYEIDSSPEAKTGIVNKRGDALAETNWNRLTAEYPTTSEPCIVRLLKSGYFDFTSVTESSNYHYRSVIVNK